MKLSVNFTLSEFLLSQTAERHGINMKPDDGVIAHLQHLVDSCLQPLRSSLGKSIYISSGYRPMSLNTLIGGSKTSAHVYGRAADFTVSGFTPLEVCQRIVDLDLPYDQNIHEFGRWTHLGTAVEPRKEDLTAYRRDGATHYSWGLASMERVAA